MTVERALIVTVQAYYILCLLYLCFYYFNTVSYCAFRSEICDYSEL